jgi:hypothetical protein
MRPARIGSAGRIMPMARGAGQQDESSRTDWGESGRSRAKRIVVSRRPTLSLITRKFARQSHAGFYESRNAAFYGLLRAVRLGSIPIARSIFRCLPVVSMRPQPVFGDQMCSGLIDSVDRSSRIISLKFPTRAISVHHHESPPCARRHARKLIALPSRRGPLGGQSRSSTAMPLAYRCRW